MTEAIDGADGERGADLLALQGVAGNVRGGDVHEVHQFAVDLRLVAPGAEGHGAEARDGLDQVLLHDEFPLGGVDEEGAGLHRGEEMGVGHAARGVVDGDVHRDDVGPLQDGVQVMEFGMPFLLGADRVVAEGLEAQCEGHLLHAGAGGAEADDADRGTLEGDAFSRSGPEEGGENIVGHAAGVAAGGVLDVDAVFLAPLLVDVVHAGRGRGDKLDGRPLQQGGVAAGAGADDERVGVQQVLPDNLRSVLVEHLRAVGLEDAFNEGYGAIDDEFHFRISSLTMSASPSVRVNSSSCASRALTLAISVSRWKVSWLRTTEESTVI